ncbi:MAG: permease [Kiritimatiellales bacterium]|nr:permease [Kiritimatiellales bacterium]
MNRKELVFPATLLVLFGLFVLGSGLAGFAPGQQMGRDFAGFFMKMLSVLPCVFILIGLFEVWVKRETIEKHLGCGAGPLSYLWAVLLAGTNVGGLHVALPVGHALYVKGARTGVVLAYLFAATICRIPMALFEATFLGWRFTAVRFAVSLPLVVCFAALIGHHFDRRGYRLPETGGDES